MTTQRVLEARTYWVHAVISMVRLSRCVFSLALVSSTYGALNSPQPILRQVARPLALLPEPSAD